MLPQCRMNQKFYYFDFSFRLLVMQLLLITQFSLYHSSGQPIANTNARLGQSNPDAWLIDTIQSTARQQQEARSSWQQTHTTNRYRAIVRLRSALGHVTKIVANHQSESNEFNAAHDAAIILKR